MRTTAAGRLGGEIVSSAGTMTKVKNAMGAKKDAGALDRYGVKQYTRPADLNGLATKDCWLGAGRFAKANRPEG